MGSSNRHWPSMFKSKHCNNHHQCQHLEHNLNSLLSTGYQRHPFTSGPWCEERTPEPKPRWNPKPEQIRILEAIFNSGMINPPRDEIRKIRARLQEYGQIGDANVFYWFQNKKSRSKHKLRHPKKPFTPPPSTSSSSSSSDKPSPEISKEITNSPSASVNNNPTCFHTLNAQAGFMGEPYLSPVGEFSFAPNISGTVHAPVDGNLLLGELLKMNNNYVNSGHTSKVDHNHEKVYNTTVDATIVSSGACSVTTTSVPSSISHFLGVGVGDYFTVGPAKSTVFINDVAFEVSMGPFNVCEAFGDDAVLIQSNGNPVFTDEWGVTVQSLQHGGYYYLMRKLASVTVSETQPI